MFLDAAVARRIVELSCPVHLVTTRPAVGVALAEGRVVTVLVVADDHDDDRSPTGGVGPYPPRVRLPGSDRAVLCDLGVEQVALFGGWVVTTGVFDADGPNAVRWQDASVPVLDVSSLYARAEAAIWSARAVLQQPEESR